MKRHLTLLWTIAMFAFQPQHAVAAGCIPSLPGLAAWWRADGDPTEAFGRGDGAFLYNAAYEAGRTGKAFALNGSSWVEVADSPVFNPPAYTIEAWVKPSSLDGDVDIIVNKESNESGIIQFEFGIKGPIDLAPNRIPVGNLAFYLGGVGLSADDYGGWVDGKATILLGQWSHVALAVGGGKVTAFVNGIATRDVSYTGTLVQNAGPLRIGSRNPATVAIYPGIPFNGLIDEVAFYSRMLSAGEVLGLAQDSGPAACARDVRLTGDTSRLVALGEAVSVTLNVTNVLGGGVPGTVFLCPLPAGVEYLGAASSQGACTNDAGVVRCDLGNLAAGANVQVSLDLKPIVAVDSFLSSKVEIPGGDSFPDDDLFQTTLRVVERTLSAAGASASEPGDGEAEVPIVLTLSVPAKVPVTVHYATGNGTATAGGDFVATEGMSVFQPGEIEQRIVLRLKGDRVHESPEYFTVDLSGASVPIQPGSEKIRVDVLDDDPPPRLTVNPVLQREGDAGSRELEFSLQLTGAADAPIRVRYATTNGTALAGTDYVAASGDVTFAPGETVKSVKVAVLGDTVDEPNELFFLQLARADGESLPDFTRTVVSAAIVDDDVVGGQLDHFEVSVPADPTYSGNPLPVQVTALDALGKVLTGYSGAVSLRSLPDGGPADILFTEFHLLPNGFVELQNLGMGTVNLAGWRLTFYDGSLGTVPKSTFNFPAVSAAPGQLFTVKFGIGAGTFPFLVLGDGLQWGRNNTGDRSLRPMAALLQDANGKVRDFFCAGPIRASDIVLPVEVGRDIWDGPALAGEAPRNGTYQRTGNRLRRGPGAWTTAGMSQFNQNVGLLAPLPESVSLPVQPSSVTDFVDGVWNGTVVLDTILQPIRLRVDDGNGHSGTSQPLVTIPADDLSVGIAAEQPEYTASLMDGRYPVMRPVVFQISITNSGPAISSNVLARLGTQLGLGVGKWVSLTSSRGTTFLNPIAGCQFGDLEPGAVATLTATYAVTDTGANLAAPQSMTTTVSVERSQPESFTANNSATASFVVSRPCVPITAGQEPVAWWRAEGTADDEWSGIVGGPVGALGYGPGRVGSAWRFNGADAGVLVPDHPSLRSNLVSGFTIECWVRMSMNKGVAVLVDKREGDTAAAGYTFSIEGGRLVMTVVGTANRPGAWSVSTPSGTPVNRISDGDWHHVAASIQPDLRSIVRIHFDGAMVSEVVTELDWAAIANHGDLRIGHRSSAYPDGFLPGQIDELTMHRRVLPADEIRAIAAAGGHGKCTATLVMIPRQVPNGGTAGVPAEFRYAVSNAGPFKATGLRASVGFEHPLGLGRVDLDSSSGPSGPGTFAAENLSIPVGDLAVGAAVEVGAVIRSSASPLQWVASAGSVVEVLSVREDFVGGILHFGGVDSDGDGMEDEWEIEFGLNPSDPADGVADLDGDGVSNLAEVVAGTSPRSALQRLTLRVSTAEGGRAVVGFEGRAGRTYTLERWSDTAGGDWASIATLGPLAEDGVKSLVDPSPSSGVNLYRLSVRR